MSDAYQYFRRAPSAPAAVVVGASPFVYANSSAGIQLVTVTGGVVPLLELDAGLGYLPLIGVAGVYVMFPGTTMRVNYVVSPPTMSMVQL